MIKSIEIKDHGIFKVKVDMTHRVRRYLKIDHNGRFKQVQFDSLDRQYIGFQGGYDYNGTEIRIKIIETS